MANMFRTTKIDTDKFSQWYHETKKKYGVHTNREFADRIGYNQTFISNTMDRGQLSAPAIKVLEAVYGLKLEDILPDAPKPEKEEPKDPPQAAVDLSNLEDVLKRTLQAVTAVQGTTDDVRKGFRVQTTPRLDTESIAEGVYSGMSRLWERNKKDVISQLRGLVFAGTYEAGKQLNEIKTNTYTAK